MKKFKMDHQAKMKLLLGLLVCIAIVGAVWLKTSNHQPQGLQSHADEYPPIHWPHSTYPATIKLINTTPSKLWQNLLASTAKKWEGSGAVKYKMINSGPRPDSSCAETPEALTFCLAYDPDSLFLAYGSVLSWTDTGHIISGAFVMNDAALNGQTPYSTPEMRNYLSCWYLGWASGAEIRVEPGDTCMYYAFTFDTVVNMQSPDAQDYDTIKSIYNHKDDDGSSSISYKVKDASNNLQKMNWGNKVGASKDGKMEIYQLDLGDGYMMETRAIRK